MSEIQELYQDADYCRAEMLRCRNVMGTKPVTQEKYEAVTRALSFIYLYAPGSLSQSAHTQLTETNIRAEMLGLEVV